MQGPPIRISLTDDHLLLLQVLAARIEMQPDMNVVCMSTSGEDGLKHILESKPDVAVMDVELPGRSAFDVAAEILQRALRTRILFLTGHLTDVFVEQAIRLKSAGYLLKGEPVEFLIDAIRKVASGETCYSRQVQERLDETAPSRIRTLHSAHPLTDLSNRQLEVLKHLARGESVKEVARSMHISLKSVDSHKYRIMHKLGIHDRVELARYAIREGLIVA